MVGSGSCIRHDLAEIHAREMQALEGLPSQQTELSPCSLYVLWLNRSMEGLRDSHEDRKEQWEPAKL